jgi:hypothetical protein
VSLIPDSKQADRLLTAAYILTGTGTRPGSAGGAAWGELLFARDITHTDKGGLDDQPPPFLENVRDGGPAAMAAVENSAAASASGPTPSAAQKSYRMNREIPSKRDSI